MNDASPKALYLKDYTVPPYLVDDVQLTFKLDPAATRVISRVQFRPNPEAADGTFFLHGEDLKLIWAKVDGDVITPDVSTTGLTCAVPDRPFVWEAEVEINPAANTALEGLYMSNGIYCTQCEAEGFRKITYYPDRPDVMATFDVTVEGSSQVLLSNGNQVAATAGSARWHDPWPKPAYLFALVAGDLVAHSDQFTTKSGRDVALNIYVRHADLHKCDFAMASLKHSMAWDERVYGREYDLDIFNIVAVDDFNAGAMENKGLNIFNSAYVLASPETATDRSFEQIEAVIAHEYFHNWTGNRITCRDWFQLCLKEGLTVYRDQQFTGDMRSHGVKRISDAIVMRAHQFREDSGPLAHPVRPASVVEINNFYTATVYEKGAEVIGMLKRLVGDDAYYRACALYFDRHDGQAATIEDWLAAFEDTTGRDLSQFARWYSQAGTPRVTATTTRSGTDLSLTLRQDLPQTPDASDKQPQVLPIAIGMIGPDGAEVLPTTVLTLDQTQQTFEFADIPDASVLSVLRDFSAPVILHMDQTAADRAHLLAHDTDPFNRWQAGRSLIEEALFYLITADKAPTTALLDGLAATLNDTGLDPAFRALVLTLPTQAETIAALAASDVVPDPQAVHLAHEALKLHVAQHLQDHLPRTYAQMQIEGPFSPDAKSAGKRDLGNCVLDLLSRLDGGAQAAAQFGSADNMTQQRAALSCLLANGHGQDQLAAFFDQWQSDKLVMDAWFGLQSRTAAPDVAADCVTKLTKHPLFDWKNPNRFRALIGGFTANTAAFHLGDGTGYELVTNWLIKLDPVNPQTTARVATVFETWTQFDTSRQTLIKAQLDRLLATPALSPDTREIVTRILG